MTRKFIMIPWPTKHALKLECTRSKIPNAMGYALHSLCKGLESHGWKEILPNSMNWRFVKDSKMVVIMF